MLDWLKNINKEYPPFWKTYLSKFDKKPDRYVILQIDASGTHPAQDVIYSFGAIAVKNDQIVIADNFEATILQYKYLHDNGLPNTFLIDSKQPKMTEPQAIEAFVEFLGNSVLVGHRIHYTTELINSALEKLYGGRLKNEALDIEIMHKKASDAEGQFTLEKLFSAYKTEIKENDTTAETSYNMALIFLKLKRKLRI